MISKGLSVCRCVDGVRKSVKRKGIAGKGGMARKEKNIWLEGGDPAFLVRADSKGLKARVGSDLDRVGRITLPPLFL